MTELPLPGVITLNRLIAPIQAALDTPGTREVVVNKPGEFGVENGDGWTWHEEPRLTFEMLEAASRYAARLTGQDVHSRNPSCSSRLPGGQRITIVMPPAYPQGRISWTIRKRAQDFVPTLDWLEEHGWFRFLPKRGAKARPWRKWFQHQIEAGSSIALTGVTGSSKTTAAEAMIRAKPLEQRIITLESVPEWEGLPHRNWVPIVYAQKAGTGLPTAEEALEMTLRQRPDCILFGEVRTGEAWGLIRVMMSGARGTIMTAHANPGMDGLVNAVYLMVRQNAHANGVDEATVKKLIRENVDIVVHCQRVDQNNQGVPYRAHSVEIMREVK